VRHASPRIIAHEHVPNVYDTLWATSRSGVGFAVCSRGSSCRCLLIWIQSLTTSIRVSCCCRAGVLRFMNVVCIGVPRTSGYKWQYILIAAFSSRRCWYAFGFANVVVCVILATSQQAAHMFGIHCGWSIVLLLGPGTISASTVCSSRHFQYSAWSVVSNISRYHFRVHILQALKYIRLFTTQVDI